MKIQTNYGLKPILDRTNWRNAAFAKVGNVRYALQFVNQREFLLIPRSCKIYGVPQYWTQFGEAIAYWPLRLEDIEIEWCYDYE